MRSQNWEKRAETPKREEESKAKSTDREERESEEKYFVCNQVFYSYLNNSICILN